ADDFTEREEGSAEIAALPVEALKLVEAALKKGDLDIEVRTRLEAAVGLFKAKVRRSVSARRQEARVAWARKTVSEAYEKVGHKDPKWDASVRAALPLLEELWEGKRSTETAQKVYELCVAAIQAGCDDPLVIYARARMYDSAIRKSW